jgi:protocatechuate 3,4-dioxygenase, beta subunit
MSRILTPQIGRRQLVRGIVATAAATPLPDVLPARAATSLVATPAQTEGPFYPTDWSGDIDNDLVVVRGAAAHAQGQITHVLGRILDASGAPIPNAAIEIWQCDATGIYRHPRDSHWLRTRDAGFQGRGRARSDASGSYTFARLSRSPIPGARRISTSP